MVSPYDSPMKIRFLIFLKKVLYSDLMCCLKQRVLHIVRGPCDCVGRPLRVRVSVSDSNSGFLPSGGKYTLDLYQTRVGYGLRVSDDLLTRDSPWCIRAYGRETWSVGSILRRRIGV